MGFTKKSTCSKGNSNNSMRTTIPNGIVNMLDIKNKDELIWSLEFNKEEGYLLTVKVQHKTTEK